MASQRFYLNWGGFLFTAANQAQEFGLDKTWKNARQPRLTGPASTQRLGSELDDFRVSVSFVAEYLLEWGIKDTPYDLVKQLEEYGDNGEVAPLFTGWGELLGLFTMESMRIKVPRMTDNGGWTRVDLDLVFKEYVE
jgi:phage protein U